MLRKILAGMILLTATFSMAQSTGMKLSKTISLPGDEGWDYLCSDDSTGRLFVSHGSQVQVVDEKSGSLLGTISGQHGVHGIALAPAAGKGYISNGRDSSVTVFDLKTYAVLSNHKVTGVNPDAILYDPFSKNIFVYNGRSANATVISTASDSVIATIPLDGKPEFSVSDGAGYVYVNIEDKSEICRINATSLKVENTWSVAPGKEPSGLAIDRVHHRLFSVCDNEMMVVLDAQSGKVIAHLKTGDRTDGAAFDAGTQRAYSSNGEGTLTVIEEKTPDKFVLVENVSTKKGARTCAVNQKTHQVFLSTADFGPPPAATGDNPHPRPSLVPGTFVVLVVE